MNLLLVNPIHPDTPHISAVRAWRFAQALAGMGHRVVLLTATPPGGTAAGVPSTSTHDWRTPLVLPVAAFDNASPGALSRRWFRRVRTAWQMLRHGGRPTRWSGAAFDAARQLSPGFRPDVIWTTFGRMEAVFVTRRISRLLGVPWVLDLKDNWEIFVPRPLRRLMAMRIRGWRAITANAIANAKQARRWHGAEAHVAYSGVDEAFLSGAADPSPPDGDDGRFVLTLVGSLYFDDRLDELMRGIAAWSRDLGEHDRRQVTLRYLGGDVDMFERAVMATGLGVEWEATGYVPVTSMAGSCRRSAVNMYIGHDESFHHKLLELLACGRPVLTYPRESGEARMLARRQQGELIEPGDTEGTIRALQSLHRRWSEGEICGSTPLGLYGEFSWEYQAGVLEGVLANATRR